MLVLLNNFNIFIYTDLVQHGRRVVVVCICRSDFHVLAKRNFGFTVQHTIFRAVVITSVTISSFRKSVAVVENYRISIQFDKFVLFDADFCK